MRGCSWIWRSCIFRPEEGFHRAGGGAAGRAGRGPAALCDGGGALSGRAAAYGGYDYAALSEPARQAGGRGWRPMATCPRTSPSPPWRRWRRSTTPWPNWRDQVDSDRLSLLLTTTGSAWTGWAAAPDQASAAEIEAAARPPPRRKTTTPTATPAPISPPDSGGHRGVVSGRRRPALERARMAAFFGVDQLCLSDLSSVADYDNYNLLEGLDAGSSRCKSET